MHYHVRVFPISPVIVVIFLIVASVAAVVIGALSGLLSSLIMKRGLHLVWMDAFFGPIGFWVGFFGCLYMPWPRNTVTAHFENGGTVSTTMNMYQHPWRVAVVGAILLPILHELYEFRRALKK
jgi:hypothetical protein